MEKLFGETSTLHWADRRSMDAMYAASACGVPARSRPMRLSGVPCQVWTTHWPSARSNHSGRWVLVTIQRLRASASYQSALCRATGRAPSGTAACWSRTTHRCSMSLPREASSRWTARGESEYWRPSKLE